jgi:hypothetical protein
MAFLLEGTLEKTECGNGVYVEIDLCYMLGCLLRGWKTSW